MINGCRAFESAGMLPGLRIGDTALCCREAVGSGYGPCGVGLRPHVALQLVGTGNKLFMLLLKLVE